jgi:zinc finger protein
MSQQEGDAAGQERNSFFPAIGTIAGSDHVEEKSAVFAVNEENVNEIPNTLCMACGQTGVTRLLLTQIPYFREVILMSFLCDSCGFKNTEVQFGGEIKEKGCKRTLHLKEAEDLNRQLIKSDSASLYIPDVDFEIPAGTQRGVINTIEGILRKAVSGLSEGQEDRYLPILPNPTPWI